MEPTRRRWLWALVLSLVLHLALLFTPAPPRPQVEAPRPPLMARLEPPPPRAKPRMERPRPRSTPAVPSPSRAQPEPGAPLLETPSEGSEEGPARLPTTPVEVAPAPAQAGTERPLQPLPGRIEIRYQLIKGDQGLVVGRMIHRWESGAGRYAVTSLATATGPFALLVRGTLIQVSQGLLTPEGLKPQSFWIQRGQSGDRTESAAFDWATGTLRFGRAGEEKVIPLAPGTQDVLSVLYQLALTAPHEGVLELPVTNGRKFDHYRYRVVGEESLETPLGSLMTEHLEKVREPGEDGLEVWLARDYRYLPVKLRLVDRKGDTAEQIAVEIRAE